MMNEPQAGDLILFQIEDGVWTAAIHPILAQKLYAGDYPTIRQKAADYAEDWAERGRFIVVWKQGGANKWEKV